MQRVAPSDDNVDPLSDIGGTSEDNGNGAGEDGQLAARKILQELLHIIDILASFGYSLAFYRDITIQQSQKSCWLVSNPS